MVLRFFKGSGPGVILMIAVIFAAVWSHVFFHPAEDIVYNNPMPLFGLLEYFLRSNVLISNIVAAIICITLVFLITNFNTKFFFITERTFLPALIFILIIALLPGLQTLMPILPTTLFIMLTLRKIVDSYHKKDMAYNFFDAGIIIGTGSLFYANLIWFGALIFIGIILFRTLNIKEIAISILGLIIPFLIVFGVYYVFGYDFNEMWPIVYNNFFSTPESLSFSKLTIATLIFISLIVIASLIQIVVFQNTKIKSRKTFSLLIWMTLISVAVYFLVPSASYELFWLLGIPISYFIAYYFIFSKKKIFSEVFFSVFFLLILLIQVLHFLK